MRRTEYDEGQAAKRLKVPAATFQLGPAHRAHPGPGRVFLAVVPGRCGGAGRRHHPGSDALSAGLRRRGGGPDRRSARHPQRGRREGERADPLTAGCDLRKRPALGVGARRG